VQVALQVAQKSLVQRGSSRTRALVERTREIVQRAQDGLQAARASLGFGRPALGHAAPALALQATSVVSQGHYGSEQPLVHGIALAQATHQLRR
jgi:hypothetical protein